MEISQIYLKETSQTNSLSLAKLQLAHFPGTKLVAKAHALLLSGSAKWSARFSNGPFPVTIA
jgi:hypothetical protein